VVQKANHKKRSILFLLAPSGLGSLALNHAAL